MNLKNMLFLIATVCWFLSSSALATPKAETLVSEYESLKQFTKKIIPDGQIGGLFNYKNYGDHQLLWDKNDYSVDGHDTVRILIDRKESQELVSVTYYYSDFLIADRTVLRRFVGPESKGWRADTIDAKTLEDIDTQGSETQRFTDSELKILRSYGITLF